MSTEKKPTGSEGKEVFTSFGEEAGIDNTYPTRDTDNKKLDVTELFTHFTASIIREDTTFTR